MRLLHIAVVLMTIWVVTPATGADTLRLYSPEAESPAVLKQLEHIDGITTVATSADGQTAAYTVKQSSGQRRTVLHIINTRASEPVEVILPDRLLDMVFVDAERAIYALSHKASKRGSSENYLYRVALDSSKSKRIMRLPSSARSLDHWLTESALLVACNNEIRTILLPQLQSGPLYRVEGENLSMAAVGGSSLLLIGQAERVLMVDLTDTPDKAGLPVRAEADAPAAVHSLAAARNGSSALALLADGTVAEIEFSPLRLKQGETAMALIATPANQPVIAERVQKIRNSTTPAVPVEVEVEEEMPVPFVTPIAEIDRVASTQPVRVPQISSDCRSSLCGRISGPASAHVTEIVVLGPNSILTVAARVSPERGDTGQNDLTWHVDGLTPGRYRIQLGGGGGVVLLSDPPVAIIDISTDTDSMNVFLKALQAY